uniref:RNA polymerase II elongation factor ELL n=1 Tax=Hadrurus spadix TaxID=141984 RepID=A0A1W7R9S7_9SCOR
MAALHEGQQYGLSSQGNYSSNKTLIFVKLTDSAIRAIEECAKHKVNSPKSTIQFQANQGIITLPRPSSPNSKQSFSFSLSSVEADGPQGSFECLQQTGSKTLQSLGCMLYKMHIHANEDSYEKTRHKMAVVEKESKMNCTKVIKATGPYLSRKVKVKRPLTSIPPPKAPSPTPYTVRPTNKSLSTVNSGNGHHHNHPSNNNNNTSNSRQFSYNKTGNPDIMKKSYRERIIHHLALRPYKKPELLARLMKDGVKEKDKKGLSNILSQVAVLKDNSYLLARHIWNEVQDDWPFYTPEEVEIMKRKKPQNLTPPNENGNHSPTTTLLERNSPSSQKRQPSTYDHQPNKKQRISHYNRMENNSSNSLTSGSASKPDSSAPLVPKPDSLSQPNKRELSSNGYVRNGWNGSFKTDLHSHKSPLPEGNSHLKTNDVPTSNSYVESVKTNHRSSSGIPNGRINSMSRPADSSQIYSTTRLSPDSNTHHHSISSHDSMNKINGYKCEERHNNVGRPKVSSTTNGSGSGQSTPVSSPESRDSVDSKDSIGQDYSPTTSINDEKEFKKKYVVISNGEQRARYKADFNTEYNEYLGLHAMLTDVSNKFTSLEVSLHRTKKGSEEWHRIRKEIVKEYEENQRDQKHQKYRHRFLYLHEKLTYIKMLVSEYDRVTQAGKS